MTLSERITSLFERLRAAWRVLVPDPGKTTLGWWLVAIQFTIVLIVGGGISYSAIGMLHDQADEEGKARVQLASATAREDLRRMGEDVTTSLKGLADRPTLLRLLSEGRTDAVPPMLRRSCAAANMDACAVVSGTQVISQTGPTLDWDSVVTAGTEQGATYLALPSDIKSPVLGSFVSLGDPEGTRVYGVLLLGEKLAKTLGQHVGLEIRLVNYRAFTAASVDDYTRLHSAALADGRSAVLRINAKAQYASCVPVFASTGEAIALLDATLPTDTIDSYSGRLIRRLLVTALVLAGLAVLAGVILSEIIAGPVKALTEAATRLGQGDFSTSIPVGGAAEVGALARTMEDMRHNLVELTGALRRSEGEAQAVLSGIVEGVYAVDKGRTIRYLNPQAAKLLGVTAENAVGRFCGDLLKPCLDENGKRPCETRCPIVQARSDSSAKAVERLQLTGGEPRTTVITSSSPVEGLQVQVIRDETELEAVRRARDSVLANISHEFRTPLAAQLASIELLLEGMDSMPHEQQQELVRSLERGTLRLTRLIDNLLESVRIESGQLSIRRQSVDLRDVVEDAQGLLGSLLALRHQTLEVEIPEDLPFIDGDLHRLTQVFVNLLANANKFAPEGTTVRIGAESQGSAGTESSGFGSPGSRDTVGPQGPRVVAWVEDEGPGPAAADTEAIFARFQRGAGEEPEPGGLGLGLWIVKSIIDRHSGTIVLTRTAQGRTRFVMTLPAETPE
ncbi:MAG TPA: ATP-binding protein [Steroidobacteraceae bacterium]|jgi:signal transduction histidine kinase/HAMP domain-containing protein